MPGVETRPLDVTVLSPLQSGEIAGSATPVIQIDTMTVASPPVILRAQPEESSPPVILRPKAEESSPSVILRPKAEESSPRKKGSFALRAQDDGQDQGDDVTLPVPFGVKILVASRFSGRKTSEKATAPSNETTEKVHSSATAAAIGTMVHAGLEHTIRGIAFNAEETWLRICDANLIDDREATVQDAQDSALEQLRAVLESDPWKSLIHRFPRRRAEVPVLFLDSRRNLHSGTIDLLLDNGDASRTPSEVMIVDFKTSHVEGDLRDHAAEHGYFDQVASYAETLRTTWPDAKIAGCVFYTRLARTVEVPL